MNLGQNGKKSEEEQQPSAGDKRIYLPMRAMFEVTRRCVMRCVHCYITDFKGEGELSTEEAKGVIDQLADMNCLELTFTGGEVFCRQDFMELCRHARKRHFAIIIFTEATLVDQTVADELKAIAPWKVEVTLLGPDAELHDRLTGIKGSFERTVRGIKLMLERGIRVQGKTVLMKHNFDRYAEIRSFFDSLGITHTCDPIVTPRLDGVSMAEDHRISKEQMKELLSDDTISPGTIMMGTSVYSEAMNKSKDLPMCKAGLNFCHIDPQGNVLPCVQLPVIAGNLREQSLEQIWHESELLQKLRRTTMKDLDTCSDCELYVVCYRCPGLALMEDGNLCGVSRTACENAAIRVEIQQETNVAAEGEESAEAAGDPLGGADSGG